MGNVGAAQGRSDMTKMKMHRTTIQLERILTLLRTAAGSRVPLPEIQACAAQYNARIVELRKRRLRIENRKEPVGDARRSWFRLVANDAVIVATPKPASNEVPWEENRPRVTGLALWDAGVSK